MAWLLHAYPVSVSYILVYLFPLLGNIMRHVLLHTDVMHPLVVCITSTLKLQCHVTISLASELCLDILLVLYLH